MLTSSSPPLNPPKSTKRPNHTSTDLTVTPSQAQCNVHTLAKSDQTPISSMPLQPTYHQNNMPTSDQMALPSASFQPTYHQQHYEHPPYFNMYPPLAGYYSNFNSTLPATRPTHHNFNSMCSAPLTTNNSPLTTVYDPSPSDHPFTFKFITSRISKRQGCKSSIRNSSSTVLQPPDDLIVSRLECRPFVAPDGQVKIPTTPKNSHYHAAPTCLLKADPFINLSSVVMPDHVANKLITIHVGQTHND